MRKSSHNINQVQLRNLFLIDQQNFDNTTGPFWRQLRQNQGNLINLRHCQHLAMQIEDLMNNSKSIPAISNDLIDVLVDKSDLKRLL